MKLSIVVGVLNQFDLTEKVLQTMLENLDHPEETELIVIDNGSSPALQSIPGGGCPRAIIHRNEVNTGNYPLFKQAVENHDLAHGEIVAFIHSDVFIYQKGWDTAVRAQFDSRPDLGLMGFIGSTELDNWGGRGMGTTSNMQGRVMTSSKQVSSKVSQGDSPMEVAVETKTWKGSPASVHGKVSAGMTIDGSVVDGCVMIFRRSVLEQIPYREEYPPHHFYDRLMSAQVIELGFRVAILGVEFDHISGQTANHEQGWQDTSREWFRNHLGIESPSEWAKINDEWVKRGNSPSRGKVPDQWDYCAYLEAERLFLQEYRDQKHLVPLYNGKRI